MIKELRKSWLGYSEKWLPNNMKRNLIVCSLVFGITVFLLAILLIQNSTEAKSPLSILTPEETAVRHVQGMAEAGFHIDPNTVEAIQQVEINGMVLVLVQYSGHRIEGGVELCEMVVEIEKKRLHTWEAKGGAGLCHEINDPGNNVPISVVSSYGTSTLFDRSYSTAFGYLRNERITKVVVTWEDGLMQQASVSERTYLTARAGGFHVVKIETYNNFDEIMFESNYPNTEEPNP